MQRKLIVKSKPTRVIFRDGLGHFVCHWALRLSLLLCAVPVLGQSVQVIKIETAETEQQKQEEEATTVGAFERLRAHEWTNALFDYGRGNDLDGHLDVQYSLKYLFTNPEKLLECKDSVVTDDCTDFEVSFTFTGEFDFFAGTRESGPVIGRRYNPGVMFQRVYAKPSGLFAYSLSVEHESNGQSTNSIESLRALETEFRELYQDEHPDIPDSYYLEMATDTISRSTEAFWGVGAAYRYNHNAVGLDECDNDWSCVEFYFKFRESFLDVEDEVFWDPEMLDASLLEHQGTQISAYSEFDDGNQFVSLVYRTGEVFGGSPGSKNTFNLSYFYNLPIGSNFKLPLIATYHYGYLEELHRYSYKTSFFSLGLFFSL